MKNYRVTFKLPENELAISYWNTFTEEDKLEPSETSKINFSDINDYFFPI